MTDWPDLSALELLVAVADHGSLSAGARAVGTAQPNASRSLARLERRLGLGLLQRSTRGSSLTPAGLMVVEWARQVLTAATELREGASTLRDEGTARLTVAASQTIAEHLLPGWLSHLRETEPSVSVVAHVENTQQVVDDVRRGRADVGFVEGPQAPSGLHHATVATDELVLVVAPDHPWARRRKPVGPDELAATPLVSREAGSGTRIALAEALAPRELAPPELEFASNAAVRVSCEGGYAPAVLSRLAVADALASRALREVPLAGVSLRRRLRAVWGGPRRLRGPAASLVAIARA